MTGHNTCGAGRQFVQGWHFWFYIEEWLIASVSVLSVCLCVCEWEELKTDEDEMWFYFLGVACKIKNVFFSF